MDLEKGLGHMNDFRHDYRKAYEKAIGWGCAWHKAAFVALRYALTGDSGRFMPSRGFQRYRIVRKRDDE